MAKQRSLTAKQILIQAVRMMDVSAKERRETTRQKIAQYGNVSRALPDLLLDNKYESWGGKSYRQVCWKYGEDNNLDTYSVAVLQSQLGSMLRESITG